MIVRPRLLFQLVATAKCYHGMDGSEQAGNMNDVRCDIRAENGTAKKGDAVELGVTGPDTGLIVENLQAIPDIAVGQVEQLAAQVGGATSALSLVDG